MKERSIMTIKTLKKTCPICNNPLIMEVGIAGDDSFCAAGRCPECNNSLSIHGSEWFVKVTEFDSWPLTDCVWIKNPERICQAAGLPADTWKTKLYLDSQVALRQSWNLCYKPLEDEIIFGDITPSQSGWCDEGQEIMVEMPDGIIMKGNTSNQGEQEDDCSYLVYKWMKEHHPNVIALNSFLEDQGILSIKDLNTLD
jgi:hypothetical protein